MYSPLAMHCGRTLRAMCIFGMCNYRVDVIDVAVFAPPKTKAKKVKPFKRKIIRASIRDTSALRSNSYNWIVYHQQFINKPTVSIVV